MTDSTAITPTSGTIQAPQIVTDNGQDMQQASRLAHQFRQQTSNPFQEYHDKSTPNTRDRQRFDLLSFTTYLAGAGVRRTGISEPLVFGYRSWMRQEGYAIGTINLRLATIRAYCELARNVRAISEEDYKLIQTVKGYCYKERRNIDGTCTTQGLRTRRSPKKAMPAPITTTQASRLKQATTHIDRQRRPCDLQLAAKDALMMGLFIEHALRVSEVMALNIEHFDTVQSTVAVYSPKKKDWQTHRLKKHTRRALDRYLAQE